MQGITRSRLDTNHRCRPTAGGSPQPGLSPSSAVVGVSIVGDGDLACWAGLVCFECGAIVKGGYHRPGCRREKVGIVACEKSITGLTTPWSRSHWRTAPDTQRPDGSGGRTAGSSGDSSRRTGHDRGASAGSRDLLEREVAYSQSLHLPFGVRLLDWASAQDRSSEATVAVGPEPIREFRRRLVLGEPGSHGRNCDDYADLEAFATSGQIARESASLSLAPMPLKPTSWRNTQAPPGAVNGSE